MSKGGKIGDVLFYLASGSLITFSGYAAYLCGCALDDLYRNKQPPKEEFATAPRAPSPKSGYYDHFIDSLASRAVRRVVEVEEGAGRLSLPPPPPSQP
mmetsp:Transcript_3304/g.8943  ORF Transcript_3304/g.8943 Transcript_3304/m.8943 type:complete len:98 (+) Transcript_3304:107-400(+)